MMPEKSEADTQMLGMNGLRLKSKLVNEGCRTPIIFVTSYDNRACLQRAMLADAIAYLTKPFSDATSLQTIRSALRHNKGDATVK